MPELEYYELQQPDFEWLRKYKIDNPKVELSEDDLESMIDGLEKAAGYLTSVRFNCCLEISSLIVLVHATETHPQHSSRSMGSQGS